MKAMLLVILLGVAAGVIEALTRRQSRRRCEICRAEVEADPLEPVAICGWHWGQGGDA